MCENEKVVITENKDVQRLIGQTVKLQARIAELEKELEKCRIHEQCNRCKFTYPQKGATCPDEANGEYPCIGFASKIKEGKS